MSDLIALLRHEASVPTDFAGLKLIQRTMSDAADELERQAKEIEALKLANSAMMPLNIAAALNGAVADRDRYKAALERVDVAVGGGMVTAEDCRQIAAEALRDGATAQPAEGRGEYAVRGYRPMEGEPPPCLHDDPSWCTPACDTWRDWWKARRANQTGESRG